MGKEFLRKRVTTLIVGMLQTNCYIVECGTSSIIIDPGDEAERLIGACVGRGIKPELIVLTHGHIDHTNAADEIKRYFDAEVICHELDRYMVESEVISLWDLQRRACKVDRIAEDGDLIQVGDLEFKVIHTPGHTQGSICLLVDSVLFSGDTLFRGSVGRTDLPGGSEEDLLTSLKRKLMVLPPETIVLPGHGPETTIAYESRYNFFING